MNNVSSCYKSAVKRIILTGTMLISISSTSAHAFDITTAAAAITGVASLSVLTALVSRRLRTISESSRDNDADGRERSTGTSSSVIEMATLPSTPKPPIELDPRRGEIKTLLEFGLTRCPSDIYPPRR